jgi:hypothetical protein
MQYESIRVAAPLRDSDSMNFMSPTTKDSLLLPEVGSQDALDRHTTTPHWRKIFAICSNALSRSAS